ncbi:MAG: MFS transporter [bacterium]|nr:MFS transporter [bacterium]
MPPCGGAGVRSPVIYMLLAWGYGILNGFMLPAWQAFIAELVPKELLLNAVTLNSTQFQATRAVGPALGGVLLGFFGPGWVFFANGVSFFAVLFTVVLIQVPRLLPDDPPPIRVFTDLREVVGYWRTQPGIQRAFKTVLITATCAQPIIFLIVVFAEEEFNTSGWQLGLLAAGTGIGSIIFFPLVAGRGQFTARSRLLGIGLSIYGLALAGFGLAPWYAMAIVFLLILGGCHLATASTLNTVIQLQVEESMRGRVIALYLMVINVAIGVGTMIQGALYDWIGPRLTVSISAATIVVLAAWLVSTRRFASMDVGTAAT